MLLVSTVSCCVTITKYVYLYYSIVESSSSTLTLLTDAVEEYIQSLLQSIKHAQTLSSKDKSNILDIETMEKGYFAVAHNSLLSLHDYFQTEVVGRNVAEIDEFKDMCNEYDKLRKESQNLQEFGLKEEIE